jgi:hypothetical protein
MTATARTEKVKPRWCFGCRKRLPGSFTLYKDGSGYLGAWWQYACDGCGKDRRWMHGPA